VSARKRPFDLNRRILGSVEPNQRDRAARLNDPYIFGFARIPVIQIDDARLFNCQVADNTVTQAASIGDDLRPTNRRLDRRMGREFTILSIRLAMSALVGFAPKGWARAAT